MPKNANPKKLSKLEVSLANALYRTWEMLPGCLEEISTEDGDKKRAEKTVERVHNASFRALAAVSRSGWKKPRS